MRIRDLKVLNVPVSTLKPYAGNPRTHSKKQVRQIAASIKAFGWTNPIRVDGDRVVIAGYGRLKASLLLGIPEVPIICVNDMTEAQKRAYILADNKLAENAGWDRELLTLELQGLIEIDLDFDVTATGFEIGEIDLLIGGSGDEDDDADELPETDPALLPITKTGDVWQAGRHRLLSADEPRYVDLTLNRFRKLTGIEPVTAASSSRSSEGHGGLEQGCRAARWAKQNEGAGKPSDEGDVHL